jgi:hypothetical protein
MSEIKNRLRLIREAVKSSVSRPGAFLAEEFKTGMKKDKRWNTLTAEQQTLAIQIVDEECNRQTSYTLKEIVKLGQVLKKRLTKEVEQKYATHNPN